MTTFLLTTDKATTKTPTLAAQRHAAGLRTIAAALTQPDPWTALRAAEEAGTLDPSLGHRAREATRLFANTQATLTLSRASALMVLRFLVEPVAEEWGGIGPEDETVDESNLNILSDQAQAIADFAAALASDASSWGYTEEDQRRQEEVRREQAEKEQQRAAEEARGRAPLIQPATVDRLRALRAAATDDATCSDLDLLVRVASAWAREEPAPAAEPTEGTPPTGDEAPASTP